ncbi:unnamed protein product [Mycena citricolor]|uniref:BTB domain-containing protein n=1 Tax=Mycena citricolor TaxID=2018698 RepID=A0AAD2Q624_9AGAR|nr:unnamed protein product [Mycena citricolor]
MFQVASHPPSPAFLAPGRRDSYSQSSRSSPAPLQLPRTLARPKFDEVSPAALAAVAPELASVPLPFVRQGLRVTAPQMSNGLSIAAASIPKTCPRSQLPSAISLSAPSREDVTYPTHILALSTTAKSATDDALIYPVHGVLLAAHCAKLPRLPPASPAGHTVPILPLAVPSPSAFALIHTWMYTGRLDAVLAALIPLPTSFLGSLAAATKPAGGMSLPKAYDDGEAIPATFTSPSTVHALAVHVCSVAGGNVGTLMMHASHVKELWQNLVALGVNDAGVWAALDLAWEVVLGSLSVAAAGQ